MTSHQTSLRESSPQHGGMSRRGDNASNSSLMTSSGELAGSGASSSGVVMQMRQYVQQVLLLCQTMLTVIETNVLQNQAGAVSAMEESTAAETSSDQQNQVNFLKTKLKELVGMNVGWQTAHSHQEQRIVQLEQMNHQLTLQLQNMSLAGGTSGQLTEQQQADIDRVLLEQRNKYMALEENCRQIAKENDQLKKQLSQYKDHVQVLEMQSRVYQEDFETERKDRERAQSRVSQLELELQQLKEKQIHVAGGVPPPFGDPKSQFCASASSPSRNPWQQPLPQQYIQQRPAVTAGYGCRYQTDVYDGDVQIDGLGVERHDAVAEFDFVPRGTADKLLPVGKDVTDSAVEGVLRPQNLLKCPKCRKEFTEDEHVELMDHMDLCVDAM